MKDVLEKKYNSDGDEVIYIGNNLWVPIKILKPKEDALQFYERYKRPKIYLYAIIKNILGPIIGLIIFDLLLKYVFYPTISWLNLIYISLCLIGLYILIRLSDIAIFCVHLYQRFAPITVRTRCSMTPTCSNYCIEAINKYGLIIGIIKTWRRLRHRCNGEEITDNP